MIIKLDSFRDYISYQHGFCHLIALSFSIVFNSNAILAMDSEAYDDNFNIIPEDCLIHAFSVLPDGLFFDAQFIYNKEEHQDYTELDVISNFEYNNSYFKFLSYQQLFDFINIKKFEKVNKNEIQALSDLFYNLFSSSFDLVDQLFINKRIYNLFS